MPATRDIQLARVTAHDAMAIAAMNMKYHYDRRHTPRFFAVGDYANLRLHRGYSVAGLLGGKFRAQFAGPFRIRERIGRAAYRLELPENWRIHDVVPVAPPPTRTPATSADTQQAGSTKRQKTSKRTGGQARQPRRPAQPRTTSGSSRQAAAPLTPASTPTKPATRPASATTRAAPATPAPATPASAATGATPALPATSTRALPVTPASAATRPAPATTAATLATPATTTTTPPSPERIARLRAETEQAYAELKGMILSTDPVA
ncbi:hypothetical protein MY11210_009673 [Beauveria gryllotalpidicola]